MLGLALAMEISCLCQFHSHWVPNANPFFVVEYGLKVTQKAASNFFKLNIWMKSIQRVELELLVKYYSRNLARTLIKTNEGDEKWPLFVNKQLFWWSASLTLDNNNAVLTDF